MNEIEFIPRGLCEKHLPELRPPGKRTLYRCCCGKFGRCDCGCCPDVRAGLLEVDR